ncbi:MAG: hypothetical protein ACTSQP_21370 [Promethearchaeota archaeon]
MKVYPNVPDYKTDIKKFNELRNLVQNGSESIEPSIQKEFAEDYIKKIEKILNEIGVKTEDIKNLFLIKVSQYSLKKEFIIDRKSTSEEINNIVAE